ncbi:MAG: septal ring lytic transglycosylase RlpA family protein [Sulfurovaceae bacterium]|nr:septal ring lytic transglycosylase RlpA family protein [Sulfurovaceae bacterium]
MRIALQLIIISIFTATIYAKPSDNNETKKCITGQCSWYGPKFNGKKTASGEKFDSSKFTAAHKTLPFGTKLKITDKNSGKSTIVVVNDRGPFTKSRVLDISSSAAQELGVIDKGIFTAEIEILD